MTLDRCSVSYGEAPAPAPAAEADNVPAPLADLRVLRHLWTYWNEKRAQRAMPRRSDIAPYEIPSLLPNIAMVDRGEGGRLRYRLMGTAVAQSYGFDATGKYFDEVFDGLRLAGAIAHCGGALDSGRPLLAKTRYASSFGVQYLASRLLLPLGDDGGRAIVLMIGNLYERDKQSAALFGNPAFRLESDQSVVL